jgi:hypothetical protein
VVATLTRVRTIVHEHAAFPSIPSYQRPIDWLLAGRTDLGIDVSASTRDSMIRKRFLPLLGCCPAGSLR